MLWKEIKSWAKSKGYETIKDKEDNQYYWAKLDSDDPSASGVAKSVSKLATAIYNHMTDNKWVEYQKNYQENFHPKKIETTDYNK
jgi:hypothetical protein